MTLLQIVQDVTLQVTGKSNLSLDTDFLKDLNLNSLDVMNMIGMFEERFDILIPTRDVWQIHQVRDVIQYLEGRGVNP